MDRLCELDIGEGLLDCGRPAVFVVWAGPYGSDLKPFYACPEHPGDLYDDLAQVGFQVREPSPL